MTGLDEKGCSNLSAPVFNEGVMPLPLSGAAGKGSRFPELAWLPMELHVPTGEHNSAEGWLGLTPPPAPVC